MRQIEAFWKASSGEQEGLLGGHESLRELERDPYNAANLIRGNLLKAIPHHTFKEVLKISGVLL